MEKRVLLAMILSFLVLVLWSYIFPPHPPVPKEADQSKTTQKEHKDFEKQSQEIDRPITESASPRSSVPEKEIKIETPLYTMLLSSDGPSIKEFKLSKYHTTIDKKELVDIIKLFKHKTDHVRWFVEGKQNINFNVEINPDYIQLKEGDPKKEISMRFTDENGNPIVEYLFTFYPDDYKIDVINKIFQSHSESIVLSMQIAGSIDPKKNYGSHSGFALFKDRGLTEIELDKKDPKEIRDKINYIALESTYFVTGLILNSNIEVPIRLFQKDEELISVIRLMDSKNTSENRISYSIYLGPKDLGALKKAGSDLTELVNFGWTNFIAKPLLYGMKFCNDYVKNYGISIIILTIFVKIIFWPLSNKSYKSMKEMQKLQPLMMKIREKYKDNKEQMNRELMQLYRTYKINPMSGCLPMLVQIPVFFALYKVLSASIELRHSPFMLWIKDLSAPDRLFEFSFSIPLMDPPYGIPVLTLLMGASMFIQQKMSPPPGDPTQAKVMLLLPVIFTFMFINFPSGLVLYWFVNNILSIGQQYYIQKKLS